jgi:hypothetical protein
VAQELRTLIEDKLEDRAQALAKPADPALAAYVLHEIGEPGEVARRYEPSPQYLVGPRFYPAFVRITKIVLPALAGALLLATVVGTIHSPQGAASLLSPKTWLRFAGLYFQVAITLFGAAVLLLAIIERTSLGTRLAPSGDWDVRDLPEVPQAEADRVRPVTLVVGICLLALFGIVLNLFPGSLGVAMVSDERTTFLPISDFGVYLPMALVNVWLGLSLALRFVVLHQRRWTRATRWAQVGVGLLSVALLLVIASRSHLQAPPGVSVIEPVLRAAQSFLYLLACLTLIDPIKGLLALVRGHRAASV